ncbi:MAG: AMP-binding protein, partial [Candidatus Binatia bacterium]
MNTGSLPPHQQDIAARCFHPSKSFTEFREGDVEQSIPERFEDIARRFPDQIAVETATQFLTYAELDAIADRVARALLSSLGSKAELVALLLGKRVPQLAAMLGVMKAGKFFLLLDPLFPQARIISMLEDSRATRLVTDQPHAAFTTEVGNHRLRVLQWEDVNVASCAAPKIKVMPKALVFINYTSGSTGEPKGLLQTHRGILHNIMLRTNLSHVCEHDRISLLSSGTANAITNALVALLNGAALLPFNVTNQGAVRLARWLSEKSITICPMGSPLFRSLCETLTGEEDFPHLRVIRLRSEAVYKTDVDLYKRYFPRQCIFVTGLSTNETGPLRDYLIAHETEVSGTEVPVGYAVPGKDVMLLDDAGKRIGFNEVGEIAVKSPYIVPGYLRRTELTRAKFKPDPSGGSDRVYLTGDLGLMLPDGCLVYKGRKDFRVKVRGYGVDIAEVEMALRAHPCVSAAVVVPRRNDSGETNLVAYFTCSSQPTPNVSQLRRFLGQTLPDHMQPVFFVALANLPLTPQNKVDRNALPAPGHSRPQLDTPFTPPQTAMEQELARIWADVLGLGAVGIHDNFFDLGGNSLSAMRVLSRMIEDFQVDLPLRAFFDAPTVGALAARIEQSKTEHAKTELSFHRSVEFNRFPDNEAALSFAAGGAAPIPETEVSDSFKTIPNRSEEQRAIQAKCMHPTGTFVEFTKEEAEQSIPQRFEKIVRLYPDRLAIKVKDRALTYDDLNGAANRIAAQILAEQRDKREPVGLLFEQGVEAITAILGALKAGQFYVALDPSFPARRLASILEDSGAGLLLTDQQNIRRGSELATHRCQLLDVDASETNVSTDNPSLFLSPETLACIMYTSGSSGQPKGVVHNHRSILHWVKVHTNQLRICPSDRLTLLQSCSAASCVHNLFGALLNGASLFPFDPRLEAPRLARWLLDEQITIYHSIPTVFRQMTDNLTGPEEFPDLRVIRLSGMAITREDVERYKKHFSPNCILLHVMGTTEAGTVPHYFIDKLTQVIGRTVPVGYAAEDAEIVLLDDNGSEVGLGQMGEIAIKSRYLALGYWKRPELTDSRFLADPGCAEQRIYLTGDLGRRAPDGCLFQLGRKDLQLKVRGYRIETREVEMRLLDHADIQDAAVVGRESQPGETQLIAYFVPTRDRAPGVSELRSFLQEKLPEYMIPSAFVPLHALPLTPNGKVDWKLLPPPGSARPQVDSPFVPPGKPVEKELARIWAELLGIDQVGIHDNFFDLGGHSLLAARVLSRVFLAYQVDVPLSRFFAAPTVAALAGYLETPCLPQDTETQSIEPVSRAGPVPLSFAQQRLWFLDQLDPGNFAYNLFSAFQLKGQLNVKALEQSFNEIIRRHETLRTVFITVDRQPLQTILPSLTIQIPVVDLRQVIAVGERGSELRRLCDAEAQLPFELRCGPLLRVTVVRLAEDESMLFLTRHHIVFDGWSAAVLFRELSALYAAFCQENTSPLPELPTQYRAFALWQRQWLQGKILATQLLYWKQQLDNLPTLQLPTDRPRSSAQTCRGASQRFVLPKTLSRSLKTLSHRESVTLFMTLLAAFQTLLHRYTGQSDIAIGSPVAGRNQPELETLIGFFLNMLVLRSDLAGNPTFRELVARVRTVCLSAYEHQDLPFEKLVEELQPERNLSHNPLFQVTLALQNTPKSPLDLAGLTTATVPIDPGIARFDLHLFL